MEIMAITAPTPMMMPSVVRTLRRTFARSARRAMRAETKMLTLKA